MQKSYLFNETKRILSELDDIITLLDPIEFTNRIEVLSQSSIGEHTRHIIELFQQLLKGYTSGLVNYDARERVVKLQENIEYASSSIRSIINEIAKDNKELRLISLYNNQEQEIESNYFRELMFNIEHCVHHQAIIKIGLLQIGKLNINDNFGVAKSTIQFREQRCVQ